MDVARHGWTPTRVHGICVGKDLSKSCASANLKCLPLSEGDQMPAWVTKLKHLPMAALDALVGVDQAGVIRSVNRQTESLFGDYRDDRFGALGRCAT